MVRTACEIPVSPRATRSEIFQCCRPETYCASNSSSLKSENWVTPNVALGDRFCQSSYLRRLALKMWKRSKLCELSRRRSRSDLR